MPSNRAHKTGRSWPELMNLVPAALDAGVSTLILGHPGLGKSAGFFSTKRRELGPLVLPVRRRGCQKEV